MHHITPQSAAVDESAIYRESWVDVKGYQGDVCNEVAQVALSRTPHAKAAVQWHRRWPGRRVQLLVELLCMCPHQLCHNGVFGHF